MKSGWKVLILTQCNSLASLGRKPRALLLLCHKQLSAGEAHTHKHTLTYERTPVSRSATGTAVVSACSCKHTLTVYATHTTQLACFVNECCICATRTSANHVFATTVKIEIIGLIHWIFIKHSVKFSSVLPESRYVAINV